MIHEPTLLFQYTEPVYVPSLPGCIGEGDSKEEAVCNIKEAIELYLDPVEDDMPFIQGSEITEVAV